MAKEPESRAYALIDNTWRHIYIVETYTQVDIFGDNVEMVRCRMTKGAKQLYEVEAKGLLDKRPRKPKKERII